MSEDRRTILGMLAAGQITADEAERLLAALEKEQPAASSTETSESRIKAKAKYLRVVVQDGDSRSEGSARVNIRVPMQLLRAGVKLASLVPAHARQQVNHALHARGVQFDLNQIKPEKLEEVIDQLEDVSVDVDEGTGRTRVRVFCE